MENEGRAVLYVLVGKSQQVSWSHANTVSLMHAGPVQNREEPISGNTNSPKAGPGERHTAALPLTKQYAQLTVL